MTTLVLFAHADPTATPPFYSDVSSAYDVEIRFFISHFKGESKAYDQLAAKLAKSGPLLDAVAEYAGASKRIAEYDRVLLASWSAGYAMVRAILAADMERVVDGWVAIDSGYGEPWPGVVELAARAQDGRALFFAGHTEIATQGYLSSGDSLKAVIAAVGEPRGRFRVEDWGGTSPADHIAALRVHGPELLRAALVELGVPARDAVAPTDPAPPTPRSTGGTALDVLAVAVAQLGLATSGGGVARYMAGCQRAGKPLGLTSGNWCAAFVGWCDHAAGASWAWRAAVSELWFDALATERAHVLGDGYTPKPGDLAIFGREGEDPRTGGHGHVGRVESFDAPGLRYTTIEGNHEGTVARVEHAIGGAGLPLLGWVER